MNINEENNSLNRSDSLDNSISTAIISRDSNGSNRSNNINNFKNCFKNNDKGFLGGKNIPDIKKINKHQNDDNSLTLEIKYALTKMREQYSINRDSLNNSIYFNNFCDYYLGNVNNDTNFIENNDKQDNINSFNNHCNKYSPNPNGFI